MEGYLGQFPVDISTTRYKDFKPTDWALEFIGRYGSIDGSHHKDWVLDQVSRILHETPVIVEEAKWSNGHSELRIWLDTPTQKYHDWVLELRGLDEDGQYEYDYDEGIAP